MAKRKSRFPSYGLVRGASHAQGGVAGMVAGEQPVELEGGEWIIPKEAVPDYLPVLKQITNEGRAMQQMDNGNTAIDALMASASMENGLAQPKSPMYQTGGVVSDKTRVGMSEYIPELSYDLPTFDGKTKQPQYSMSNMPMSQKELLDIAMGMATPGSAIGSIGKRASKIATRRDLFGRFYKDPISGLSKKGMLKLVKDAVPENTMDAYGEPLSYFKNMETDDLADALRSAYGLARNPKHYGEELAGKGVAAYFTDMGREGVKQALDDIKHLKVKEQGGPVDSYEGGGQLHSRRMYNQKDEDKYGYRAGGPINQYQQGGQMQPRRQQEIRNPEVYGPPVPADIDSLLNQIMMRDVNQSINPFSGDTLDFEEDSLRLLGRMKKSHMPTYGRKKMQQGGPVMYQQGGLVGEGQPLERRYGEAAGGESPGGYFPLASQAEPDALMGSIRSDRRIKPLQPDTYIQKIPLAKPFDESNLAYPSHQEEVEQVPKLSTAYLASFGMETPLSRKQGALLYRKGVAPQTLNPQVKGLINRALVQRLTNEDD